MAKFRKIHTSFWDDSYIEKLSAEDRYFYLFLLTNPDCSECGIYQLTVRKMSYWTGYNEDAIKAILKRFINDGRIVYDTCTNEICILHKPNYIDRMGKPVIDCIISELNRVKNKSLIDKQLEFLENEELRVVYDTCTIRGQEEEKDKEEEKNNNKNKGVGESSDSTTPNFENIFIYSSNEGENQKEKSSAQKEKGSTTQILEQPSGLEASASIGNYSHTINNEEEQKVLTQAEKFEKIISDIFCQSSVANYSDEYKNLWTALCKSPKWKKKTKYAFQLAIKQLSKYDEAFGIELMEKAISGGYQGVVYDNTDEKYEKYLQKKKNLMVIHNTNGSINQTNNNINGRGTNPRGTSFFSTKSPKQAS